MNDQTQKTPIRLVLLDEYRLFRVSLARLLTSEPGFEVVGECGTSDEALEVLKEAAFDVVLLDFDFGTENAIEFLSIAREAGYQCRFLILAGSTDVRNAAIALKLGASGFFLKSEAPERLLSAIRLVRDGGVWVDPTILQALANHSINPPPQPNDLNPSGPLDDRERNVLLGIVEGLSDRKIGDNLGVSESSVKNVVQHLFTKAGVRTRTQLVRAALEGSLRPTGEIVKREPNGLAESVSARLSAKPGSHLHRVSSLIEQSPDSILIVHN